MPWEWRSTLAGVWEHAPVQEDEGREGAFSEGQAPKLRLAGCREVS